MTDKDCHKVCTGCNTSLPLDRFGSDKRASDGRQPKCRACCNRGKRDKYWSDPESHRAKQREYNHRNPHITREINRKQREERNRESILERKREEYKRNREDPAWQAKMYLYRRLTKQQKRQYDREYAKANRDKINDQARRWRENNPEKRRAIVFNNCAKRQARMAEGPSAAQVAEWATYQEKICYWCGQGCSDSYHVDHYVPLAGGGEHSLGNLVISCPSCNYRKNAKDPYDFAQERGRLF